MPIRPRPQENMPALPTPWRILRSYQENRRRGERSEQGGDGQQESAGKEGRPPPVVAPIAPLPSTAAPVPTGIALMIHACASEPAPSAAAVPVRFATGVVNAVSARAARRRRRRASSRNHRLAPSAPVLRISWSLAAGPLQTRIPFCGVTGKRRPGPRKPPRRSRRNVPCLSALPRRRGRRLHRRSP